MCKKPATSADHMQRAKEPGAVRGHAWPCMGKPPPPPTTKLPETSINKASLLPPPTTTKDTTAAPKAPAMPTLQHHHHDLPEQPTNMPACAPLPCTVHTHYPPSTHIHRLLANCFSRKCEVARARSRQALAANTIEPWYYAQAAPKGHPPGACSSWQPCARSLKPSVA